MAKPKDVLLRDFLMKSNLAVPKSPPWVHSTASAKLIPILEQEKLLAVKCNVFEGGEALLPVRGAGCLQR